jgi:hypothetical protein
MYIGTSISSFAAIEQEQDVQQQFEKFLNAANGTTQGAEEYGFLGKMLGVGMAYFGKMRVQNVMYNKKYEFINNLGTYL